MLLSRLHKIILDWRIAVINVHYPTADAIIFVLMRRFGLFNGTLIMSMHGSDVSAALRLRGLQKMLWQSALRGSDEIITVSHSLARNLLSAVPDLRSKVHVIYNGVDASLFQSAAKYRLSPKTSDVSDSRSRIILCIASLDRVKGIDILLNAFCKLLNVCSDLDIRLLIVGESGDAKSELRTLCMSLGINAHVEWRLNVEHSQIGEIMQKADMFVLSSRNEGFPLVLLEAGAAALPVIATRVGGVPELIDNGVDGLLVEANNTDDLARAMHQFLGDSAGSLIMGRKLQQKVLSQFSWENTYRHYEDLASGKERRSNSIEANDP